MKVQLWTVVWVLWCAFFTAKFVNESNATFAAAMGILLGLWLAKLLRELDEWREEA